MNKKAADISPVDNIYNNLHFAEYCNNLTHSPVKKLLLMQNLQVDLDNFNYAMARNGGYYIFPPTGLQYIYDSIKGRDIEVIIFDVNFELLKLVSHDMTFKVSNWLNLIEDIICEFSPDAIGVSCLFDFSMEYFLKILKKIKQRTNAIVIAGGVVSTYEWKNILKMKLAHFCIEGEGENKINYLLDHICDQKNDTKPNMGIHYCCDEKYYETKGELEPVSFDSNLIDTYKIVPIEEYSLYGSLNPYSRQRKLGYGFATIQLSRGCRAHCTFCSVRDLMGKGVRNRSATSVVEEIEYLVEYRNVRHIEWLDDDLLFDKKDFKFVLQSIIDKKLNITWSANNGVIASSLNEELVDLMEKSGCIGFKIGIESGNEEMLKKVLKPSGHKHFLKASSLLMNRENIFAGGNFIVGLPEEKFYMMMDTFLFALKLNFDWSAFTVCQEIRGASAFSEMGDIFEKQILTNGKSANQQFIPTRESNKGYLLNDNTDTLKAGLAVFSLDPMCLPDKEQIKEIWLTFNIIINYLNNKNLSVDGNIYKFIRWIETALKGYPTNPYMNIFLAYAYIISGENVKANALYNYAMDNMDDYWEKRFKQFYLDDLTVDFPDRADAARIKIEKVRDNIFPYYCEWVNCNYSH
ncbi:MAG: radical SAM protein [Candidatus Sedimenticola sp. (ex Thyasira tokunagai)]